MRDAGQTGRRRRSGSRLVRLVAYLLVIAGGAALGWCLAVLADAYLAQRFARAQLESTPPPASVSRRSPLSPPSGATPDAGTPLAELSIPRIGLSLVVLQGSDEQTLRKGLGHIEDTSLPGESGNVAIAGHRDSFFRPLRNIQVGDDIMLDIPGRRVHYRVSAYRVVGSTEVSVIAPTTDAVLTLVTCYPFWFVGSAPDRFVVRANLVEDERKSAADAPSTDRESTPALDYSANRPR